MNNSIVTTLSNCLSHYCQEHVERFSHKQNKKIQVQRPKNIKIYNDAMGGVDLLHNAVTTYQINIKRKKCLWSHFTKCLGILMAGVLNASQWNTKCSTVLENKGIS